jgi:hypothetical protein
MAAQTSLLALTEAAAARAERQFAANLEQRKLRLAILPSGPQRSSETLELELERKISLALIAGIRSPHVRLDSVGIEVLSGHVPEGPGFES